MKLLKISSLYKKKKRDDKDTPKNDPNMSNSSTILSKDNNTVNSNDLRKSRTAASNSDIFSDCGQNNVNTPSPEHAKGKNKHGLKNIKSCSTHQHKGGVLDSDISDSDDAKQEDNKLHPSNNRKSIQPIINNSKQPLQYEHRQRSSDKVNPDTATVISTSSKKISMNDPVIARMQDRHRNQVKMAALRKQQILLEDEEKRQSPGSVHSPQSRSPSVSSFSGNHYYPYQQSPLPPMVPYMVLSPYATPMMDPYIYHSHTGPLQKGVSSHPSYVSLPGSLRHNQHSLYNEQQQQQQEDNKSEVDSTTHIRTRSTSALPTLTKINTYSKKISYSQSSSDTELSTPSKESLAKEFTYLDDADEEDSADADIESDNEDDSAQVGKLRQKDNHHDTSGCTRTRSTRNEEEYFNHCDRMQACQKQWYGQQKQQQQQQYPIYSPYYFQSAPPLPSFYAGMDPYYAQQDRRTFLMSNGPISQG